MGQYFKPLRRKIGVLTLVVACVFGVGLVRSLGTGDEINGLRLPLGTLEIFSEMGDLRFVSWSKGIGNHPHMTPEWLSWQITNDDIELHQFGLWSFQFDRMDNRDSIGSVDFDVAYLITFPYWSIIVPLTSISAWLLLSKPRARIKRPVVPASENA